MTGPRPSDLDPLFWREPATPPADPFVGLDGLAPVEKDDRVIALTVEGVYLLTPEQVESVRAELGDDAVRTLIGKPRTNALLRP